MSKPTNHGPVSEGKIEVLKERYASGQNLWHPDDSTQYTSSIDDDDDDDDDFDSGVFFDEEEIDQ